MTTDVSSWLPGLLGPVIWKENGTAKAARQILNFVGVTITDNGSDQLTFTVNPSSLSGLAAGIAAWLATPTSANLRAAMTDEAGGGALMFAPTGDGLPHIVAGALQAAASKVVNADVDPSAAIALSKLAPIVAVENNALTGTQHDLALSTPSTVPITVVRFTDAAGITISSIAGGVDGRILILIATEAATTVTFQDQTAGGGTAANRLLGVYAADLTLNGDSGVGLLVYDATTQRWRQISRAW